MGIKEKKAIFIHLLLISAVLPQSYGQNGIINGVAGHTASTFKQTHSNFYYPTTGSNGYPHPAAKGYFPVSALNSYNVHPINGQYWTGQPYHYTNYQQYPQYRNHYWNYPDYDQYYPQQYSYAHQMSGYNNYYGQYPYFDAQYWTGNNYYPSHMAPIYAHPSPLYMHPVPVYHKPMYYPRHQMMYNRHYPHHSVHYQTYPYYGNQFDRGFLGGTGGELTKGLLGALLVGAIAGTVARRG